MTITARDIRLVLWINGWGACTLAQIAVFLMTDISVAARRVRILIEAKLLRRLPVQFLTSLPIVPTSAACALANDPLPPLSGVRIGTWRHDSLMVDLERGLERYFGGSLEPERRIRSNRKLTDLPPAPHTPDALIQRPGRKPIAIELELSRKTPTRLRQIIDGYAANTDFDRVAYVTNDEKLAAYIRRFTNDLEFIDVKLYRAPEPHSVGVKPNSENHKPRVAS